MTPEELARQRGPARGERYLVSVETTVEASGKYEAMFQVASDLKFSTGLTYTVVDAEEDDRMCQTREPVFYVSHSVGRQDDPDWWVVKPNRLGLEDEVDSLRRASRRVLKIDPEALTIEEVGRAEDESPVYAPDEQDDPQTVTLIVLVHR